MTKENLAFADLSFILMTLQGKFELNKRFPRVDGSSAFKSAFVRSLAAPGASLNELKATCVEIGRPLIHMLFATAISPLHLMHRATLCAPLSHVVFICERFLPSLDLFALSFSCSVSSSLTPSFLLLLLVPNNCSNIDPGWHLLLAKLWSPRWRKS